MGPGIDLRLQQFAVVLAEELSFSRAAQRLRIAQPSLSRAIRQLEDYLGVPLFARTSRVVSLTEEGKAFVYEARKALHHAARAIEVCTKRKGKTITRIVIAYPAQFNSQFILDLAKIKVPEVPDLQIVVESSLTPDILRDLRESRLDAGIIVMPKEYPETLEFKTMPLFRFPLLAAVHCSHPLAKKPSLQLLDLKGQPLVYTVPQQVSAIHAWIADHCRAVGFVPQVIAHVKDAYEHAALLFQGNVIGLGAECSRICARGTLPENIVIRRFCEPELAIESAVVFEKKFYTGPLKPFLTQVARLRNHYNQQLRLSVTA